MEAARRTGRGEEVKRKGKKRGKKKGKKEGGGGSEKKEKKKGGRRKRKGRGKKEKKFPSGAMHLFKSISICVHIFITSVIIKSGNHR